MNKQETLWIGQHTHSAGTFSFQYTCPVLFGDFQTSCQCSSINQCTVYAELQLNHKNQTTVIHSVVLWWPQILNLMYELCELSCEYYKYTFAIYFISACFKVWMTSGSLHIAPTYIHSTHKDVKALNTCRSDVVNKIRLYFFHSDYSINSNPVGTQGRCCQFLILLPFFKNIYLRYFIFPGVDNNSIHIVQTSHSSHSVLLWLRWSHKLISLIWLTEELLLGIKIANKFHWKSAWCHSSAGTWSSLGTLIRNYSICWLNCSVIHLPLHVNKQWNSN